MSSRTEARCPAAFVQGQDLLGRSSLPGKPFVCLQWVNFDKIPSEHNESAISPKLAVKAISDTPRDVRVGSVSTELTILAYHLMSASLQKATGCWAWAGSGDAM